MSYCKYHPLESASYYCENCAIHTCENCINDESRRLTRCIRCDNELTYLGAVHTATPFWRRLKESFHYPLNKETLIFLGVISALSVVSGSSFILLPLYLLITGAFFKYCFSCLSKTAHGDLSAPDITEAYEGGLILLGKILVIIAISMGMVIGSFATFGYAESGIISTLAIIALPAIFINLALSDDLIMAINPLRVLSTIISIGLPYGLLLAFIIIMTSSVAIISEVFGGNLSFVSLSLQTVIANYYTIVIFHIMGYIIFQYQDSFDITAGEKQRGESKNRTAKDQLLARMDIALKEGYYQHFYNLLKDALKQSPNDRELLKKAFDYLFATKNTTQIKEIATRFLLTLQKDKRDDLLKVYLKKTRSLIPNYIPRNASLRHSLAEEAYKSHNYKGAASLINGLQKDFPQYPKLVTAYEILLNSLKNIPELESKIPACEKLIHQLKEEQLRQKKRTTEKAQAFLDNKEDNQNKDSNGEPEKDYSPIEFK